LPCINAKYHKTNAEAECFQHFSDILSQGTTAEPFDIDKEIQLLREIKGIRDELKIVSMVFDEQINVLGEMRALEPMKQPRAQHGAQQDSSELLGTIERYKSEVKRMKEHAETNYEAVGISLPFSGVVNWISQLKDLMDLKQKQANLSETRSTRQQGNTIMVFTIVTIIFVSGSVNSMQQDILTSATATNVVYGGLLHYPSCRVPKRVALKIPHQVYV
jgi:hypothetical protein